MPKMNGFEVYRQLSFQDSGLKVCLFTAFEIYKDEFSKVVPKMKSIYLVRKPTTLSMLTSTIEKILVEGEDNGSAITAGRHSAAQFA
jgi:two-component SAPR family response regulator